jgi:hypothetical protein
VFVEPRGKRIEREKIKSDNNKKKKIIGPRVVINHFLDEGS